MDLLNDELARLKAIEEALGDPEIKFDILCEAVGIFTTGALVGIAANEWLKHRRASYWTRVGVSAVLSAGAWYVGDLAEKRYDKKHGTPGLFKAGVRAIIDDMLDGNLIRSTFATLNSAD